MKKIIVLICAILLISGCSKQDPIVYDDSTYTLNGTNSFSNIEYLIDTSWTKKELDGSMAYYPESNDVKQITIAVLSDVVINSLTDEILSAYINGFAESIGKESIDYQRVNVNGFDGAYCTFDATINNKATDTQMYTMFVNGELVNITFSEENQISQNYYDCAFNIANSIKYIGTIVNESTEQISEIDNSVEELDSVENDNIEIQNEVDVENNSSETTNEASTNHFNSSGIPVVDAKLKDVMEVCNKYGLKKVYDDVDAGDGTMYRDLQNDTYGLMTTIIYDKKTDEVVSVDVVPNAKDSHEKQINYILDLAEVCASDNYKEEVVNWFKNNIGSEAETTIDGIEYWIHNGACDNYCAAFGEGNWEDWVQ